jgi:hypothetical protein
MGVTAHVLFYFIDGRMIMATYEFASLLNTTDGMTQVTNFVVQTQAYETEGVSWYHYAGITTNKLYVNKKGYIGLGIDTAHLKMFYHSPATDVFKVYRQEGILNTGTKFLKLRVNGEYYYSANTRYAFEYEVFLFDDGNIFIYIIKNAKDKYNVLYGICEITDGKTTKTVLEEYDSDFKSLPISRLISNAGIKLTVSMTKYTPIKEIGARVKTNPSTVYLPNKLDWSELAVESYDASGNTNVVSNFTFPDVDVSTVGTKTVNLSYKTYSLPVEITVKEDKVLELTKINLRDHYLLNEALEVYSITAVWESGKNETLTSGFDVSGFDSATPGTKELTISYKGVTVTKSIYIAATATLTVDGAKTEYYIGDEFESVSGVITYDDGKEERAYELECSGFDNTLAGEQVITATVRGLSATYTVNVFDTISANIGANVETDVIASLNLVTGLLTVSGTGDTKSIETPSYWGGGILNDKGNHSGQVKKIVVQEGITGLIGACFYGMLNVTEVSLSSTLKTIGTYCFYNCSLITSLTLPEGLEVLQNACFLNCEKLTELTLPESLATIEASIIGNSNLVLTVLSRTVQFDNYAINTVKTIRGYIGSTAETYAKSNNIPFEIIDKILKIEIVNHPSRAYHVGEAISKADLTVKITFEDGTEQETDLYGLSYDFGSTGTKTVTITIGDKNATFDVNVVAYKFPELVGTAAGMHPIRDNVKNDNVVDTIDGVGWFKFNNAIADKLYVSSDSWIGFGVSTAQLNVCNRGGAVWSIYRLETALDNGTKVLKIYIEGYTQWNASGTHESQIKYELFLFSNGDMYLNMIQSPGSSSTYKGESSLICNNKTTTLSLDGATPEKPVQVSFLHQDDSGLDWAAIYKAYNFIKLTGITVTTLPKKVRYKVKETFDPTGITVTANYDDGTSKTVTDYAMTQPDMTTHGSKTITITYEDKATTFEIMVIDVSGIEVTAPPKKTRYYEDDIFSSEGIEISLIYTDGSKEKITGYSLSKPDMSSGGEKIITVTYNEFTATFAITVVGISGIEVSKMPIKTEYYTSDSLDTSGLEVISKYTDGTSRKLTDYSISKFDSSSVGEKTITVTYKTHTTTFKVLVYELQGIRITHYPEKTYYRVGETFDPTGLVVVAMRTDNTEKEITDYTVSGFNSSKAGVKTITVSYQTEIGGIETFVGYDEFEIKVTKDGTNPFEDNTDPINVKVHWINGEFEDLTNDNIQSNTLSLQESLCNKAYFIFGGCISNQITFKCYHQQFIGTDESTYPSGKIEVYLECKGTEIKIFTGEIATGERDANSFVRTIVAYDYLYKLRNTDIAWWYKNNTKDKQMVFTQKQFRDALFKYLGIEQVDVKLKYDSAYVPNTANSSEMNVANILEDLCLQNNVFGWMNRDGKFEYKKLKKNCKHRGTTVSGVETFDFYESAVHLDRFKSFKAAEGRVWFFNYVYTDPDPSGEIFTSGEPTAQDAYERNVFYNRNSFFVGNQDWLNFAYDANEYGDYTRTKPKYAICYGTVAEDIIKKQYYRAQGYSVEVQGNPFNMVGQTVEMTHSKLSEDGSAIQWTIHSYIMSRTLKLGITGLIDTYTANNSPYNGNNQQLGKNTPEITSTINRTRSEMPTISYAEFTDGTESGIATIDDFSDGSGSTSEQLKKAQLRCVKRIKKADYDALVAAGTDRTDTLYFTFDEG